MGEGILFGRNYGLLTKSDLGDEGAFEYERVWSLITVQEKKKGL